MSLLAITSGDIASRVVAPEGVDFDGVNDYLSRSTDLVGNVDGKAFTFSAWVYYGTTNNSFSFIHPSDNTGLQINIQNGTLYIYGYNASSSVILNASVANKLSINTFNNIIISIDLSSTTNRYIYINDNIQSPTWTTYSNANIDTTRAGWQVNGQIWGQNKGRLSNLFLDYTYRDLSIEANRRLFITADGKPA